MQTFTAVDWSLSAYLALVGISVAFVLQYTDSLVKNMVSIATICVTSGIWFTIRGKVPTREFVCGIIMCTLTFVLYYIETNRVNGSYSALPLGK